MSIRIDNISVSQLGNILKTQNITNSEKIEILKEYPQLITEINVSLSSTQLKEIYSQRSLIKGQPIKNSIVKKGDRQLLAQSLNIEELQIDETIENIVNNNFNIQTAQQRDDIEKTKAYIYRHGKYEDVVEYLKYELSEASTTLQNLYKTLGDDMGGLADYFSRPIHPLSNEKLEQLQCIIENSLNESQKAGAISGQQNVFAADWAIQKIYDIQNNQKLINAAKIVNSNS